MKMDPANWIYLPHIDIRSRLRRCQLTWDFAVGMKCPVHNAGREKWFGWARAVANEVFFVPPDAQVVAMWPDHNRRCFTILVCSEEFDECEQGMETPEAEVRRDVEVQAYLEMNGHS